ncbi:type II secretion system major pseudopilin GspG [Methylobacterium marchantiae]|uniref:Type II secretion system core protein G n=1 Tax=Methylobacterium marchantiae TaxID=600331 RepID=A0ABW3X5A8_9HYPH|nr:Type II secretion system protein G [Methylobacterium marchantiae]
MSDTRAAAPAAPGEEGFSLVELLVVLAIIGMIATMVTPQVLGYLGRAKGDSAKVQAKNIARSVELYYLDAGSYPNPRQGLAALVAPPGGVNWQGPYVRDAKGLTDPWGRPYLYRSPGPSGTPFEVYTLGRDGQPGGTGEDADASSN